MGILIYPHILEIKEYIMLLLTISRKTASYLLAVGLLAAELIIKDQLKSNKK